MPKPQFTLKIPTDYDGNKHRSIDQYHGRDELQWQGARRHEGIIIVRFELMFKVVCSGCERYISMGNRYDADKKIIGKYHSTPVYKFTMNCHICLQKWEIRTDPETLDYVCMSGCRRKEENWDTRDVNGLTTIDSEVKKKLLGDKMYNKEYKSDDKRRAAVRADELRFIEVSRKIRRHDWDLNRELRIKAKERREKEQAKEKEKLDFKNTKGVAHDDLVVLSSDEEDNEKAIDLLRKNAEKRKQLDDKMLQNSAPGWDSDEEFYKDTPCSSKSSGSKASSSSKNSKKSEDSGKNSTSLVVLDDKEDGSEKSPETINLDEVVSADQQIFLSKKQNSAKDAKTILRSNIGTDLTRNIIGKGRSTEKVLQNSKFKNFGLKKSSAPKRQAPEGLKAMLAAKISKSSTNKKKIASMVRIKK